MDIVIHEEEVEGNTEKEIKRLMKWWETTDISVDVIIGCDIRHYFNNVLWASSNEYKYVNRCLKARVQRLIDKHERLVEAERSSGPRTF